MPETTDFRNGLDAITKLALDLADQTPSPVILIDGKAGAGKSSFALELRNQIFRSSDAAPVLVLMDDLYPGWDGLRAGSNYLNQNILQGLRAGQTARWQLWDWEQGCRGRKSEPGNGWREFAGGNLLIVEGCGAISRTSRDLSNLAIWIEAPAAERKARWHERDAGKFDEYWGIWQAQEDEFHQTESSKDLADWTIQN